MYLGSDITSYVATVGIILIFLFVVSRITEQRPGNDDDDKNGQS